MEWSDVVLVVGVGVALWTFLPRHIRHTLRSGLEPTVIIMADTVRAAVGRVWPAIVGGLYRVLIGRSVELSDDGALVAPVSLPVSEPKLNNEIAETPRPVGEIHAESFTLGINTAVARMVAARKVGLTDGVKIGADAKSGERYQKHSREIQEIVKDLEDRYPRRTPEQENMRKALGIGKPPA
jgi:hypothetical protein